MPPIYSQATINATSETFDITSDGFRVIFNLGGLVEAVSQADNVLLGRDRVILPETAKSLVLITRKPTIKRYSAAVITVTTNSKCLFLATIPAIPAPSGNLFLEGKPLKGQRLPKGGSYSLAFTIIGKRLKGLQIQFSLRTLRNEIVLAKSILVSPGGVCIEEFIDNTDGSQTLAGFILLLPHETHFPGFAKELELKFSLSIGNASSREHLLESEFINFYTA